VIIGIVGKIAVWY